MSIREQELSSLKTLLKKGKADEFWSQYELDKLDFTLVYENVIANNNYKKGNSLLHLICRYNRHDLLKQVKDKISVEAITVVNKAGWTPLATACRYGALECFEILENHGAKVNLKLGWGSPLILACQRQSFPIVKKICSLVADKDYINYVDDHGVSALYMSIYVGAEDIFFYLIERGASISVKIPPRNGTMLHAACELGREKIIDYLIESGLTLNTQDEQGNTPLHLLCAESEDVKLVRRAIAKGGDLNVLNNEGEDVYNYTLNHDNVFMAEFLEKILPSRKADADKQTSGANLIKLAAVIVLVLAIFYQVFVK